MLEEGNVTAVAKAFEDAWLATYGMNVDASVTNVMGTFKIIYERKPSLD